MAEDRPVLRSGMMDDHDVRVVQADVKKGGVTVTSAQFQIIVPWSVSELGTVSP